MGRVLRLSAASLLCSALCSFAPGSEHVQPTLDASAPKLGSALTLTVSGIRPGAWVALLHSTAAASSRTPFGTLELRRADLTLVAAGPAGRDGRFTFERVLPLDPDLAEVEGHFQALVEDAAATAGALLSQALHLRYLGTRLYVRCMGPGGLGRGLPELRIFSALDESLVATVRLADSPPTAPSSSARGTDRDGEPVFTADLALGAVVVQAPLSGTELVVFDNFSGEVRGRLRLSGATGRLIGAPDGRSVLALETQPRPCVVRVDLEGSVITARVPLPELVSPVWTCNESVTTAYVAEHVGPDRRTAVRRLDLSTLTPMDSLPVGERDSTRWVELRGLGGQLYATTMTVSGPYGADGFLSVIDTPQPWGPPQVVRLGGLSISNPTPVPAADLLLATVRCGFFGCEDDTLTAARLHRPTELSTYPWQPHWPWVHAVGWVELVPQGTSVWALEACCDHYDGDGSGGLYRLDTATHTWSRYAVFGYNAPTHSLEVVRDAFVDKVYATIDGQRLPSQAPKLFVLDQGTGASRELPIGWYPFALHAVTVP